MSSQDLRCDPDAEQVVQYLYENPKFFHAFPELLNILQVPHPTTGHEVSLLERQIWNLRQQKQALQIEIDALKEIAGENGRLLQKVQGLGLALMQAETSQAAVEVVYQQMKQEFAVPYVALFSWDLPNQQLEGLHQLGMSQTWLQTLRANLQLDRPTCGELEPQWQKGLFPQVQASIVSICLLPLGKEQVWGLLALGSDGRRFHSDQDTYFLKIMGQMITARLEHLFIDDKSGG